MGAPGELYEQCIGHELRIGQHTMRFEPPDLYLVTAGGDVELTEMREIVRQLHLFAEGKRWVFGITISHKFKSFPMSIRAASLQAPTNVRGLVTVGASPRVRLIGAFVARAFNALYKATMSIAFVDTEAEARAWVAERRRSLENGPPR